MKLFLNLAYVTDSAYSSHIFTQRALVMHLFFASSRLSLLSNHISTGSLCMTLIQMLCNEQLFICVEIIHFHASKKRIITPKASKIYILVVIVCVRTIQFEGK
jgi:hypothetical protein